MVYHLKPEEVIKAINRAMIIYDLTKKDFEVKVNDYDFSNMMKCDTPPPHLRMVHVNYFHGGFLTSVENLEIIREYLK